MKSITVNHSDKGSHPAKFKTYPDKCPQCHHSIDPTIIWAFGDKNKRGKDDCLQAVYQCPRTSCFKVFIAYHHVIDTDTQLQNPTLKYVQPISKVKPQLDPIFSGISPSFVKIYGEAHAAEEDGLSEICGVGYRKALEFLIKDYLIEKYGVPRDDVEKSPLGSCITDHVDDSRLKAVAKRATWLGNDEAHYLKKWEEKDLADLKMLIDLTLHWIKMEELTKAALTDMPEPK